MTACALFVAIKVRDIGHERKKGSPECLINPSWKIKHADEKRQFPKEEMPRMRERLVTQERILLPTLGFQVAITSAHTLVARYCKAIQGKCLLRGYLD